MIVPRIPEMNINPFFAFYPTFFPHLQFMFFTQEQIQREARKIEKSIN